MFDNSFEHTCQYLDELHVSYKILKDPTMERMGGTKTCEALGCSKKSVFKSVMFHPVSRVEPVYIAVLPVDQRIDFNKIEQRIGKKCIPASSGFVRRLCSEPAGEWGPFFPTEIPVFLHQSAKSLSTIVVNAGGVGNFVELSVDDLILAAHFVCADISNSYDLDVDYGGNPNKGPYGNNIELPVNTKIDRFAIKKVRYVTPVEIFYEAQDEETGREVDICELFPRFEEDSVCRGEDGKEVKWLKNNCDLASNTHLSSESGFNVEKRFYGSFFRRLRYMEKYSYPQIINAFELNNTFYTVYDHVPGKSVRDLVKSSGTLDINTIKEILYPLLSKMDELPGHSSIRPDTVYIDLDNKKAYLLPFCAQVHSQGGGMRFFYNNEYTPYDGLECFFPGKDDDTAVCCSICLANETAFYRVICYVLTGGFNFQRTAQSIREMLPVEEADLLVKHALLLDDIEQQFDFARKKFKKKYTLLSKKEKSEAADSNIWISEQKNPERRSSPQHNMRKQPSLLTRFLKGIGFKK